MPLPNFPSDPINGNSYIVNGVTFLYRVTAGVGEFVSQSTGGSSTGGGIVYSNSLPTTLVAGVTYFDPEAAELVFSYEDSDSIQYLAFPLLAGSGSLNFVGGSSGGTTTTLSNAGSATDGVALVQELVGANYPIRRIKAGPAANMVLTESGNSVIVDGLIATNAGSTGFGLVNTKTATQQPFKRLAAGPGVTITDNGTHLTFSSSGGGTGTLGDTLTRLQSIDPALNNSVPVFTAAGATQFLTTASTRAMMGLSTVGNTIPMFTGDSTATIIALTPFMVTMLEKTGIPTALSHLGITSGSNGNGAWLRIATGGSGGVQICWHTLSVAGASAQFGATDFYYSPSDTTWTYPQSFAGAVSTLAFPAGGNLASIIGGSSPPGVTSAGFRQGAPGTTSAIDASVFAIGVY